MRGWRLLLLVVPTLGMAVAGPPARAAEYYSQEKCSLCHIRDSVFFIPGFASPETLKAFGEERVCYSCHNGTVRDSRDVLWRGAQHPPVAARDGSARRKCSACHSPHAKGGWGVLAGTAIPIRRGGDATCAGCHPGYERAKGAIHRTGFPDGGCAECHRAHGGSGKALLREARGTLCLRCHPDAASEKSGGHPVARAAASRQKPYPDCMTCHPIHGKAAREGGIDSQCAGCHVFRKAGAPAAKAHRAEAACTECHSFHARSGADGRGLRGPDIRPDVLCGRCHAARTAEGRAKAREKGTHPTGNPGGDKDLCLACHRIHGGAPGTALLATGKAYSCLECHEAQNTINEVAGIVLAHPVFERVPKGRLAAASAARRLTLGPGGEIVCRTCHAVHGAARDTALLAPTMAGEGSCLFCHEGMGGRNHLPPGKAAVGPECGTCHPVHGKRGPRGATGATVDVWAAVCATCHVRDGSHVAATSPGGGARPADLPGFDGRGRMNRAGAISCPTCHAPHGAPRTKRLRRAYESSGFLCTACHRAKENVALTPHDLRGIAGRTVCEPCHRPHGGKARAMWGIAGGEDGSGAPDCRSCHREKGLAGPVPAGGHPVNIVVPRPVPAAFPLFGVSGAVARNGLLTCSTCHEVHGLGVLLNGQGTGMLLRAGAGRGVDAVGRVRTCLPCHQGKQATHGQADCIWCHPPHEKRGAGPDCRACHAVEAAGIARTHGEKGRGCGACHRIHAAKGGASAAGACLECHPKNAKVIGTTHAGRGGSACGACHPAHRALDEKPVRRHGWEEVFRPDLPCLRCHRENGEGPAVARGDHPKNRKTVPTSYGAVVTLETPIVMLGRLQEGGVPLFPLFDETGRAGLSGRIACLTCHDPHAGNKMKDGESGGAAGGYLRDPSGVFLAEVCAPCHKDAAGERVRKFHELPRKTE